MDKATGGVSSAIELLELAEGEGDDGMAREIEAQKAGAGEIMHSDRLPEVETDTPPASYAQKSMWALSRLNRGAPLFNSGAAFCLRGPLDLAVLENTITALTEMHDALRTVLETTAGGLRQKLGADTRILAVLEPRSNTMKLGAMKDDDTTLVEVIA